MVDSIGYLVKNEFMDDVPENSFPGTSFKHGVLLVNESAKEL